MGNLTVSCEVLEHCLLESGKQQGVYGVKIFTFKPSAMLRNLRNSRRQTVDTVRRKDLSSLCKHSIDKNFAVGSQLEILHRGKCCGACSARLAMKLQIKQPHVDDFEKMLEHLFFWFFSAPFSRRKSRVDHKMVQKFRRYQQLGIWLDVARDANWWLSLMPHVVTFCTQARRRGSEGHCSVPRCNFVVLFLPVPSTGCLRAYRFHLTSLHFTSPHLTSLPFPSLPFPSLPFPSLPFPSLPFMHRDLAITKFAYSLLTSMPTRHASIRKLPVSHIQRTC